MKLWTILATAVMWAQPLQVLLCPHCSPKIVRMVKTDATGTAFPSNSSCSCSANRAMDTGFQSTCFSKERRLPTGMPCLCCGPDKQVFDKPILPDNPEQHRREWTPRLSVFLSMVSGLSRGLPDVPEASRLPEFASSWIGISEFSHQQRQSILSLWLD